LKTGWKSYLERTTSASIATYAPRFGGTGITKAIPEKRRNARIATPEKNLGYFMDAVSD
jgi:hypothetical protein